MFVTVARPRSLRSSHYAGGDSYFAETRGFFSKCFRCIKGPSFHGSASKAKAVTRSTILLQTTAYSLGSVTPHQRRPPPPSTGPRSPRGTICLPSSSSRPPSLSSPTTTSCKDRQRPPTSRQTIRRCLSSLNGFCVPQSGRRHPGLLGDQRLWKRELLLQSLLKRLLPR